MDTMVTKIRTSHGHLGYPVALNVEELAALIASKPHAPLTPSRRARLPQIIFGALFGRNGLHEFRQPTGLVLLHVTVPADAHAAALQRQRLFLLPRPN